MALVNVFLWIIGIVLFIALLLHVAYVCLRVGYNWDRTVRMDETGPYIRWYFCAIMQSFYKKAGVFVPFRKGELVMLPSQEDDQSDVRSRTLAVFHPDLSNETMHVINCYVLHDKLHLYRKAIDFGGSFGQVPPIALCCYFNKAIIALGSSEFARSRILGGVHMKQQVTIFRDLRPLLSRKFKMAAFASEYRVSERGVEVDIVTNVLTEQDTLVWQGIASGISLKGNRGKNRKPKRSASSSNGAADAFVPYKEETLTTDDNTGIKFAIASQDYQPQHLFQWTARLVGFKKPIAHGLWTMAVTVDRIMRSEACYAHAYPLNIETTFKRPLVLGTSALLQFEKPAGGKLVSNFRVVEPGSLAPILIGKISVGPKDNSEDGTVWHEAKDGQRRKDE